MITTQQQGASAGRVQNKPTPGDVWTVATVHSTTTVTKQILGRPNAKTVPLAALQLHSRGLSGQQASNPLCESLHIVHGGALPKQRLTVLCVFQV
jgi:hypothetical protein